MSYSTLQAVLLAWAGSGKLQLRFQCNATRLQRKSLHRVTKCSWQACVCEAIHAQDKPQQSGICAGVHAGGPLCSVVLAGITLDPWPSGRVPVCGNFPDLHEPAVPRLGAHEEV